MAIANTKSRAVSNRDASPRVPSPAHLVRGPLFEAVGNVEIGVDDEAGSTYRMARLRSSDRVSQLTITGDRGTIFSVGLYRTADDGGQSCGAGLFSAAVESSQFGTDVPIGAAVIEKRLWERLGLSADPQIDYDVVLTNHYPGSVCAGPLALRIRFTGGY